MPQIATFPADRLLGVEIATSVMAGPPSVPLRKGTVIVVIVEMTSASRCRLALKTANGRVEARHVRSPAGLRVLLSSSGRGQRSPGVA